MKIIAQYLNKLKLSKAETIGFIIATVIIIISAIFFFGKDIFYFLLGISLLIIGLPFFFRLIKESRTEKEKEEMFVEFSKNLVESVRAGTPISKSIINIRSKNYGILNPYVNKLANQISLGIPLKQAFDTFARDLGSVMIKRSVIIISESESAGGQIEDILESVVKSVSQVEKLRKERLASVYSLVVQGYIIFFIFIIIMLIMQFKILPIATGLSSTIGSDSGSYSSNFGSLIVSGKAAKTEQLTRPFLWLLISQGFFTGLVIGKLSEGKVRAGFKHSFILVIFSIIINTGANVFLK